MIVLTGHNALKTALSHRTLRTLEPLQGIRDKAQSIHGGSQLNFGLMASPSGHQPATRAIQISPHLPVQDSPLWRVPGWI